MNGSSFPKAGRRIGIPRHPPSQAQALPLPMHINSRTVIVTKTLLMHVTCAALLATGAAHAQTNAGTTGATAASPHGSSAPPKGSKSKSQSKAGMAEGATDNRAGGTTSNSTSTTSGPETGSGTKTPTTSDPIQTKNARDGSPMKSSGATAGGASGAGK
jgi:hypothetical protein